MIIKTENGRILLNRSGCLTKANLSDLTLIEAYFENEILDQADFSRSILTGASFINSQLLSTVFDDAIMQGVLLMDSLLKASSFQRSDLYWARAAFVSFENANLSYVKFNGADLTGCNFAGATLMNADLGCDNLGGPTIIHGANFTDADLSHIIWKGAEYDSATAFPSTFNPVQHGLVFHAE